MHAQNSQPNRMRFFQRLLMGIVGFACLSVHGQITSNKGTDFWVGYMGHIDGTGSNMSLYITSDVTTTGGVSIPGKSWSTTFSVTANSVTVVSIPQSLAYMNCSDCILAQGIHVTASDPVVVYAHIYANARSDATLVLPTSTAGREYYAQSFTQKVTGSNRQNEFMVIGLEDSTYVDITPAAGTLSGSHSKGITYSKLLMQGQVYQVQSDSDLTGSHIVSSTASGKNCKRIAVFSGSSFTPLGCSTASSGDNLFQQLYPVSAWGKTYATAPMKTRKGGDYFRVMAAKANTAVTINGWNTQTIGPGQYYEWLTDSAQYINSTEPVQMAQYQRTQNCDNVTGDPSMIILNSVEQQLDDITLYSSPYQNITGNYINVLMESDDTSSFTMDGSKVSWNVVPKNTDYAYTQVTVNSGNHHLKADSGFNAIAYGFGNVESYGYSAGANIVNLVQSITVYKYASACKGVPLQFNGNCIYTPLAWKWNFGDGGTDSVQNPKHTFADTGNYRVSLVTVKNNGNDCESQDSTLYDVHIYPLPVASFVFDSPCTNAPVKFTSTSSVIGGSITLHNWDFGDTTSTNTTNPGHQYAGAGTRRVVLAVTSAGNCYGRDTQYVTVSQSPAAKFYPTQVCLYDSITLADSTTLSGQFNASYACYKSVFVWGDGNTDTLFNTIGNHNPVRHWYSSPGSYTPKLIGIDCNTGCKDSFSTAVNLEATPVAGFAANSTCEKDTLTFTDTSFISYGNIVSWRWNFGDNTTVSNTSPQAVKKVYATAGTYTVKLVVTNTNGCSDSTSLPVTIYPKPRVGFTAPDVCFPSPVSYTDTSGILSGNIAQRHWFWGDGGDSSNGSTTMAHSYSQQGSYPVKLLLRSDMGCSDSVEKTVNVWAKPVAGFVTANGCEKASHAFTDTSAIAAQAISKRFWNFGNGDTATTASTSFYRMYADTGTFNVTLTVTSSKGCSDTVSASLAIFPKPLGGLITQPDCVSDTLHFYDSSSIAAGGISLWKYTWGDSKTTTYTSQPNPALHKYTLAGTYAVSLLVTSDRGCSDTVTDSVKVYKLPIANFITGNLCENANVQFTDKSTKGSAPPYKWVYDFGDGNTDSAWGDGYTEHYYGSSGTKTVKLILHDTNGCRDAVTKIITVEVAPKAGFGFSSGCVYDSAAFTNTSSISKGSISTYLWQWGDGAQTTTVSAAIIRHLYASSGYKQVTMVATSNKGCTDTASSQLYLKPKPVVQADLPNACFKDSVYFIDQSTIDSGSLLGWNWNFGDGGSSPSQHAAHKYDSVGNYPVKLVVNSSWGCLDSFVKTFTVNSNPLATIGVQHPCKNDSVLLMDSTAMAFGTVYRWHWQTGDGDTSNLQHIKHKFADTGTYSVKLFVQSGNLCKDSVTRLVKIYLNPVADFSVADACQADSVLFQSTAASQQGNIQSYQWHCGNGDSVASISQSGGYLYSVAGSYVVKHTVTAATTCTDTVSKSINIWPKPLAAFTWLAVCNYDSLRLADSSTIGSGNMVGWHWNTGDGFTVNNAQPSPVSHLYASPGTYPVSLLVTSDKGCNDTVADSAIIHPVPVAAFAVNQYTQCFNGHSFEYADSSHISGGGYSRLWKPGDGSTDTTALFIKKYNQPDTFEVVLVAVSALGCIDSVSKTVMLHASPVAALYVDTHSQCMRGNTFVLADSSAVAGGSVAASWHMGDGSGYTQKNISHSYTSAGSYTVALVATATTGCTDSVSDTLVVHPMPVASFSVADGCAGDSFSLKDNSSIATGTYSIIHWKVDSQQVGAGFSVYSTVLSNAATTPVGLLVASGFGCPDSVWKNLTVHPLPFQSVTIPDNCLGQPTELADSSSLLFGAMQSWQYQFGDSSSPVVLNGSQNLPVTISHTYTKPGTYSVAVTHSSQFGCSRMQQYAVTIHPLPVSALSVPDVCMAMPAIAFDSGSIAGASVVSRWFNFGDGYTTVSATSSVPHTYAQAGHYQVSMVSSSNKACTDTAYDSVTIHPHPAVSFLGENACMFDTASFADFSTIAFDTIQQQRWNFGDSVLTLNQRPFSKVHHVYSKWGQVPVSLTLASNFGCESAATDSVEIFPLPQPVFSVSEVCHPDTVKVLNGSTIPAGKITACNWNWGDGNTQHQDSVANTMYLYGQPGDYKVRLVTVSERACVSSYENLAVVHPLPQAVFEADRHRSCPPLVVQFTDKTKLSRDTLIAWEWTFGDGDIAAEKHPAHLYPRHEQLYLASLKVTSNAGCSATYTDPEPFWVSDEPKASFVANYDSVSSLDAHIDFVNTSHHPHKSYWQFGDGTEGFTRNISHHFTDSGRYLVRLVVTNAPGCTDTAYRLVFVSPDYTFYIPNSFSPNGDFLNETWGPDGVFTGIRTYRLRVWNRWGEKVFETTLLNNRWNGNYHNGNSAGPQDVYFYRIDFTDYFYRRHHTEGMLHLIR